VLLLALEDGVQPPVAAQPGERAFNHPADASRDEPAVASAGEAGQGSAGAAGGIARREDRLDGDAERLTDVGQPLAPVAQVAERRTLEATLGEGAQNRHDAFGVMPVRRRDVDRQRDAVFVDGNMDLDALDLLPAVIAMAALRSAAPARGGFGPERSGRAPSFAIASSSTSTSSSTNTSTSANASHGAGDVFAGRTAVHMFWPRCYW
jgi:hypothetical protein